MHSPLFFNDPATTQLYTLSLHDALPISRPRPRKGPRGRPAGPPLHVEELERRFLLTSVNTPAGAFLYGASDDRSEEHTSELQSQSNLVCRLLLEKKKKKTYISSYILQKN